MEETKTAKYTKAFATRLNEALDELGIPPKNAGRAQYLSDQFGLTIRGASKWVNGESIPRSGMLKEISSRLNIDFHWLVFGCDDKTKQMPMQDGVYRVPLIEMEQVSSFRDFIHDPLQRTLLITKKVGKNCFAVQNNFTNSYAELRKNSTLVFDPDKRAMDNQYVLLRDKEKNVLLRRFVQRQRDAYLYPIDSRMAIEPYDHTTEIFAILVYASISY